ncbi:MAG: hypothetical protein [Wendovervirus sonii]|uniref:Uncharacterized protein n=1 Tax=phage Lak_Megaphage_Sonny TaxID=3109229 RepID=A0ABZ0Z3A4_9CAUD|nr:MAG: hypothetical protein [phage Lak_Megaphage_Sonny]
MDTFIIAGAEGLRHTHPRNKCKWTNQKTDKIN